MKQLSYATLQEQGYDGYLLPQAPERILQFGEGAFLRAFVEAFVDEMNEKTDFCGKVVVVQPRGGHPEISQNFAQQDGLYTLLLRGQENGQAVSRQRVISCVSRCLDPKAEWETLMDCAKNPDLRFIVSNTTEAGIAFDSTCRLEDAPPSSFPAKLTAFLYRRFQLGLRGFWILPCELNDHNGDRLRSCVEQYIALWELGEDFATWVKEENPICSTLVDRIVTGYPASEAESLCEKLGYRDALLNTGEVFASWVIEAPQALAEELPMFDLGLPVQLVEDHTPYKQRKVRILNGAHTSMVLGAYLAGQNIVRDCMADPVICRFLRKEMQEEILPTLQLPRQELESFASAVIDRFQNPYIDHALLAIALNSTSKWQSRILPTLLDYQKQTGKLPRCLTFSFAAYLAFYHRATVLEDGKLMGERNGERYAVQDDRAVLEFYYAHRADDAKALVDAVAQQETMWGMDLRTIAGFVEQVTEDLVRMEQEGSYVAMKECLGCE